MQVLVTPIGGYLMYCAACTELQGRYQKTALATVGCCTEALFERATIRLANAINACDFHRVQCIQFPSTGDRNLARTAEYHLHIIKIPSHISVESSHIEFAKLKPRQSFQLYGMYFIML